MTSLSPRSDFVLPVSQFALLILIGFMLPNGPNMIFDQIAANATAQGFVLVDDDSLFRTFFDHAINSGFQRTDPSQGAVEVLLQVFTKPLEIVISIVKGKIHFLESLKDGLGFFIPVRPCRFQEDRKSVV